MQTRPKRTPITGSTGKIGELAYVGSSGLIVTIVEGTGEITLPGISVNLQTTGRPVTIIIEKLELIFDNSVGPAAASITTALSLLRNGVQIRNVFVEGFQRTQATITGGSRPQIFTDYDAPAGVNTYTVGMSVNNASTAGLQMLVSNVNMNAKEE